MDKRIFHGICRQVLTPFHKGQRGEGSMGVTLWLCMFASLMVFYSGHLYSNDAVSKLEAAKGLFTRGSTDIDEASGAWGHEGRGGRTYPHFSIGSVLMMVPAVAIVETGGLLHGRPLPPQVLGCVVTLLNVVYTASAGLLVFVLLIRLGAPRRRALWLSCALIFCSEMLPYSSSGWSEVAAFLWGLTGFTVLSPVGDDAPMSSRRAAWAVWGACAACACLIRIEYTVFFVLFLGASAVSRRRFTLEHLIGLLILGASIPEHLAYNAYRYGDWLDAGYVGRSGGAMSLLARLVGLPALREFYWFFLSFGKVHWFWVAPLLALVPSCFRYWRHLPAAVRPIFAAAMLYTPIHVYLIDTFPWCCTCWCWSYRYFYVAFPYLLLPMAFLPFEKRALRIAAVVLTASGAVISVFASTVNFHVVLERFVQIYGYDDAMYGRTMNIMHAPFWEHVRVFGGLFANTVRLAFGFTAPPSWDVLRTDFLDIWPVGLVGGLWSANVVFAVALWMRVAAASRSPGAHE
jgi:hypothetical protein